MYLQIQIVKPALNSRVELITDMFVYTAHLTAFPLDRSQTGEQNSAIKSADYLFPYMSHRDRDKNFGDPRPVQCRSAIVVPVQYVRFAFYQQLHNFVVSCKERKKGGN